MNLKGKMIVGTNSAFIILDPESGDYAVLAKFTQLYHWGITWSERHLFTSIWLGHKSLILGFRKEDLQREMTIEPPQEFKVTAPHQICWIDGRIWIANCQFDQCTMLDPYSNKYEIWNMFDPKIYNEKGRGNNHHHMNGLWLYDGHIYAVAHNREKPSFVQIHKYPSLKLVDRVQMGQQIHNVWNENDEIFTCSSKTGQIVSNRRSEVVKTRGFPRGASITKDYNCIGISPYYPHQRRQDIDGEVQIYDKNWKLIRTIVTRDFGQVFEIRTFGEKDLTHWDGSETVDFGFPRPLRSPIGECYRIVND
jgi:hypothetical protein